jgi:hypothetical protein
MAEKEMEEEFKKHRFRPPMNTADHDSHDAHVRKLREQQKK